MTFPRISCSLGFAHELGSAGWLCLSGSGRQNEAGASPEFCFTWTFVVVSPGVRGAHQGTHRGEWDRRCFQVGKTASTRHGKPEPMASKSPWLPWVIISLLLFEKECSEPSLHPIRIFALGGKGFCLLQCLAQYVFC